MHKWLWLEGRHLDDNIGLGEDNLGKSTTTLLMKGGGRNETNSAGVCIFYL